MKSDGFWMEDYKDEVSPEMIKEIHRILAGEEASKIEEFVQNIRHPINSLRACLRAHSDIPDAKEVDRYITKLNNKIELAQKHLIDLSELLSNAPYELSRKASEAKTPTHKLADDLTSYCMLLNDFQLPKSKKRPELNTAVQDIALEFEKAFGLVPAIKSYRETDDIKLDGPTAERFTPLLATLLNRSIDYAYRLAVSNLPS